MYEVAPEGTTPSLMFVPVANVVGIFLDLFDDKDEQIDGADIKPGYHDNPDPA